MQNLARAAFVSVAAVVLPVEAFAQTYNTGDRSVLLVLDASGSMNAKLPNSETRIAVQLGLRGIHCALVESRTEVGRIPT